MKRKKSIKLLTLIMSVILLLSLFGTAGTALADESEDSDVEKSTPPGQLVRNGLIGPVVNITSGYFLVETNLGIVQVCTNQTIDASIGQRVAVKLGTIEGGVSEYAHNGTDNGTTTKFGNIYRVATALQFRLIPSKGIKHKWGYLESSDRGCVFVDEEGNEIPAKCSNPSGNVIGLVGDSGNGTGGNATPLLLQTQQMSKVKARIQLRLEQADAEGDEKTCEWLQYQLTLLEAKQLRLGEKMAERATIQGEKTQKKGQR